MSEHYIFEAPKNYMNLKSVENLGKQILMHGKARNWISFASCMLGNQNRKKLYVKSYILNLNIQLNANSTIFWANSPRLQIHYSEVISPFTKQIKQSTPRTANILKIYIPKSRKRFQTVTNQENQTKKESRRADLNESSSNEKQ